MKEWGGGHRAFNRLSRFDQTRGCLGATLEGYIHIIQPFTTYESRVYLGNAAERATPDRVT